MGRTKTLVRNIEQLRLREINTISRNKTVVQELLTDWERQLADLRSGKLEVDLIEYIERSQRVAKNLDKRITEVSQGKQDKYLLDEVKDYQNYD